jgi:type IV secretory pathway VirJ component
MKPFVLALIAVLLGAGYFAHAEDLEIETLQFGRFGTVNLYRKSPHPSRVVLFVSGDGGWNLGVVDMAKALCTLDALVVGIDIIHYIKELESSGERCSYPASDFEMLSKFVQKKLNFSHYVLPVLVGYSSGATLVYGALVQAPPNTFRGAISLGFCPDLFLTKPLCRGNGLEWKPGPKGKGYSFLPAKELQSPWIGFQGTIDQVCDPVSTEAYVKQVKGGEIVLLPKVGHGFSVQRNWMPQFRNTFLRLVEQQKKLSSPDTGELKDLPLVEVRGREDAGTEVFAVIVSGDGGWAGLDRELAAVLSAKGLSVVGLNSLQYFWTRRTPEGAAKDLERILKHYSAAWNKKKVILIGYSLGADVLPFMANRLPYEMRNQVHLIALLGPGRRVDFEFHLTDWVGGSSGSGALPILPEAEKLRGIKLLCFCGEEEKDTLCRELDPGLAKVIVLSGGHHFGGNYAAIAEAILKEPGLPVQP